MSKAVEQQEESKYTKLSNLNVSEHVEKKGRFSYLSWTWAIDTLRKFDPTAIWEVKRFDGKPYLKTECGYFVEVAVTVDGITLSQIHPVLDNNNRPITQPNSFQINTSIQRCLVKAIALHGLGLYIYAGEDLPDTEKQEPGGFSPHSDERNEWGEPLKQAVKKDEIPEFSAKKPAGDIVILYIEEIEKKEGINAKTKKPWTSWSLKVGNSKWGTFSGTIAALAEEAKSAGKPVEVTYIVKEFAPGKSSNEIVTLKILDDTQENKEKADQIPF